MANMIKELLPQVKGKVAFANDSLKTAALYLLDSIGVDNSEIESHVYSGANVWMRDYGAVFAIDSTRQLAMLDFGWNQYGQPDWRREHWPQYFESKYDSIKSAAENSATSRIDSLMGEVKSGPIPESLRHLPKVERPAFKRKKRSYSKGSASKSGAPKRKSS